MRLDEIIGSAPADGPTPRSLAGVADAVQSAVGGAFQNTVSVAAKLGSVGSNGGADVDAFFACVEIEQKLLEELQPLFAQHGLRLEAKRRSQFSEEYRYTAVCDNRDERAALLQLPSEVLRREHRLVVAEFVMMLKAFRAVPARLLAAQESGLTRRFLEVIGDEWSGKRDWGFVAWADVQNTVGGKKYGVLKIFELDAPAVSPAVLTRTELKPIADVLAMLATDAPIGVSRYFEQRVKDADWPDPWKAERQGGWTGDALTDASALVSYAFSKGSYPGGCEKAGQSVIGWLLYDIVKLGTAGGTAQSQLSRFVIDKQLLRDANALELLRSKVLS